MIKSRIILFVLPLLLLFQACGSGDDGSDTEHNSLNKPVSIENYSAELDSMVVWNEISKDSSIIIRKYITTYRDQIPKGWTYAHVMESAAAADQMKKNGIRMRVDKFWSRKEKKIIEFRFELAAKNMTEAPIRRFRGNLAIRNDGHTVWNAPKFAIAKMLKPGEEKSPFRLEFSYTYATGNELNDYRLRAMRDTIDVLTDIAKSHTDENFEFTITDIELADGSTPDDYFLLSEDQRGSLKESELKTEKTTPLLKWASNNEDWLKKMRADFSPFYLEVTPVLTDKGEMTHGEKLVFDRIEKVEKFFVEQRHVPQGAVRKAPEFSELRQSDIIDFWNWPMEIRIYEGPERED